MTIYLVKGEKGGWMNAVSFEIMVSNERAARALRREAIRRHFDAWYESVTVHGTAKEAVAEHDWILSK